MRQTLEARIAQTRSGVLQDIDRECERVEAERRHDPTAHPAFWHVFLSEEVGEVAREIAAMLPARGRQSNPDNYRTELVHVAAVAVRAIQAFDRKRARARKVI